MQTIEESLKKQRENIDILDVVTMILGLLYINADNFSNAKLPDKQRKLVAISLLDIFCVLSGNCNPEDLDSHEKDLVKKVSGSSIDELLKYVGRRDKN